MRRPPNFPITQIKDIYFKNPFFVLPQISKVTNPNGRVTPDVLMYYKALARCEAAVTIAGPATITPPSSRKHSLLRVDQPKYLDGLRALCKIIESNGSMPGLQIVHTGHFEANQLLEPLHEFGGSLDDFPEDKLITVFRNACERSVEVGFRYVELSACDCLVLHQLIHEDRRELVEAIFENAVKAVGQEAILGVRYHPSLDRLEFWARKFLALGGDVVGYHPEAPVDDLPLIRKGNAMRTLISFHQARELRDLHQRFGLFAMPFNAAKKAHQVHEFFQM